VQIIFDKIKETEDYYTLFVDGEEIASVLKTKTHIDEDVLYFYSMDFNEPVPRNCPLPYIYMHSDLAMALEIEAYGDDEEDGPNDYFGSN